MFSNPAFRSKWMLALCVAAVILTVAITYWPVVQAQFVYDDILDFQKMAWLRHGSDWQQLLLRRFNDWVSYFRPLGIALFALEVRLFGATPGPMHLVSLGIHLINTLLVGVLAAQIEGKSLLPGKRLWIFTVPMLLYGLHPLLVEPVVWIGCQFDLTATLFMLLGWIANIGVERRMFRALGVAICFFLAACSKESALAFPFIIAVFDWIARPDSHDKGTLARVRLVLIQNRVTYLAILAAGAAYLALRHWALGEFMPSNGTHPLPALGRLQEVSFLYLRYWRMFFWPAMGMGPMHPIPTEQFFVFSIPGALQDAGAASILSIGVLLTARRLHAGALILCVTFALLPVLHVIGGQFDASLYHERYAMTALTIGCAWLPSTLLQVSLAPYARRALTIAGIFSLAVWSILSIMTIHVTVPLWSTQVKLWQWALEENPDYVGAKDELISAYMDQGSYASAWKLIDEIVKNNERCMNCMLNAATLSIQEDNPQRASLFLQKIKDLPELYASASSYRAYLTTVAQTELLERNIPAAEAASKAATALDNLDPQPQLVLASALALEGKRAEALQYENAAIALLTPEEQPAQRRKFKKLLDSLRPALPNGDLSPLYQPGSHHDSSGQRTD